jgi:hypothetical protein
VLIVDAGLTRTMLLSDLCLEDSPSVGAEELEVVRAYGVKAGCGLASLLNFRGNESTRHDYKEDHVAEGWTKGILERLEAGRREGRIQKVNCERVDPTKQHRGGNDRGAIGAGLGREASLAALAAMLGIVSPGPSEALPGSAEGPEGRNEGPTGPSEGSKGRTEGPTGLSGAPMGSVIAHTFNNPPNNGCSIALKGAPEGPPKAGSGASAASGDGSESPLLVDVCLSRRRKHLRQHITEDT